MDFQLTFITANVYQTFHRFVCQYAVIEIVFVIWCHEALGIQKYCKINEARQQYFIQYFQPNQIKYAS